MDLFEESLNCTYFSTSTQRMHTLPSSLHILLDRSKKKKKKPSFQNLIRYYALLTDLRRDGNMDAHPHALGPHSFIFMQLSVRNNRLTQPPWVLARPPPLRLGNPGSAFSFWHSASYVDDFNWRNNRVIHIHF